MVKALTGTIERTRFVTKAEEVGVEEFLLVDVEAMTMPFDRAGILLENFSGKVGDGKAEAPNRTSRVGRRCEIPSARL